MAIITRPGAPRQPVPPFSSNRCLTQGNSCS